eukprot:3294649-Amphidinium_carterae.1
MIAGMCPNAMQADVWGVFGLPTGKIQGDGRVGRLGWIVADCGDSVYARLMKACGVVGEVHVLTPLMTHCECAETQELPVMKSTCSCLLSDSRTLLQAH